MTPRQIAAYLLLANKRRKRSAADTLILNAYAAQASGKDIAAAVKSLLK